MILLGNVGFRGISFELLTLVLNLFGNFNRYVNELIGPYVIPANYLSRISSQFIRANPGNVTSKGLGRPC
jgi:hypothetical protein